MKICYYTKIYAIYLGTFTRHAARSYSKETWHRFESESGDLIEAKHFSRSGSGSTPRKLKRLWHQQIRELGHRKALVVSGMMPVGTRVKLYKKSGQWHYRHIGE